MSGAFGKAPRPWRRAQAWEPVHYAGVPLEPALEHYVCQFNVMDGLQMRAELELDCRRFRGENPRAFVRNPGRLVRQ